MNHLFTLLLPSLSEGASLSAAMLVWFFATHKSGGNELPEGISLKVRLSGIKFGRSLGGIAQLVERLVRNEKVWGSTPHTSTKDLIGMENKAFNQD